MDIMKNIDELNIAFHSHLQQLLLMQMQINKDNLKLNKKLKMLKWML